MPLQPVLCHFLCSTKSTCFLTAREHANTVSTKLEKNKKLVSLVCISYKLSVFRDILMWSQTLEKSNERWRILTSGTAHTQDAPLRKGPCINHISNIITQLTSDNI